LLEVASRHPGEDYGVAAMKMVLDSGDLAAVRSVMRQTNSNAVKLVEALGNTRHKEAVPLLLDLIQDKQAGVEARREAVRRVAQIKTGAGGLVDLAGQDKLPADLRLVTATELNHARWADVREAAAKLLPMPEGRNHEVLPPVRELLKRRGDAVRGAEVFARKDVNCMSCHKVNGQGTDLGPGLSEIGDKLGKDAIYEAILEPSAGISFGYEAWHVELNNGDDADGIIVSETQDELTLKDARAVATKFKKSDIKSRRQLKTSLMPTGLQQNMSTQDLVDLVEYLASLKKAK
jgi:putative heme-binding domain-containing protein